VRTSDGAAQRMTSVAWKRRDGGIVRIEASEGPPRASDARVP
jgi:hypothetical protein